MIRAVIDERASLWIKAEMPEEPAEDHAMKLSQACPVAPRRTDEIRRFLAEETIFHGASNPDLDALTAIAVQRAVPQDGRLFAMDQPCDALHIVVEGCALLVRVTQNGRQQVLHRALAGDMVGAVPFFDGKDYPATFVAESQCLVLSFSRERLQALFAASPALVRSVIGVLVERLRLMVSLVEKMSFADTVHRLWDYLLEISGQNGPQGFPVVVDMLPTRERLANAIGTVREVVSRQLSRLVESGHLRIEGKRAVLLKALDR